MNPQPDSGFWSPSPWYLSQVTHLLAGPAVLFAAVYHGWSVLWVVSVFAVLTALKEFVIDLSPFESDTVLGSTEDFSAYQIGMVGAVMALHWFWAGVVWVAGAIVIIFLIDLLGKKR